MYSSHSNLLYLFLYIMSPFLVWCFLCPQGVLGDFWRYWPPWKWTWMPTLPQMFLKLAKSLGIRCHHMDVTVVVVGFDIVTETVLGLCVTIFVVAFCLRSVESSFGILPLKFACASSLCVEYWHKYLVPCVRVLNTVYLANNIQGLSSSRYWSVWIEFLWAEVSKVLSAPVETKVYRS